MKNTLDMAAMAEEASRVEEPRAGQQQTQSEFSDMGSSADRNTQSQFSDMGSSAVQHSEVGSNEMGSSVGQPNKDVPDV